MRWKEKKGVCARRGVWGYRFKGQRGKKGGADTVIAPMIFPERGRGGGKGKQMGSSGDYLHLLYPPRRKGIGKVKKEKGRILCIPPKKKEIQDLGAIRCVQYVSTGRAEIACAPFPVCLHCILRKQALLPIPISNLRILT